RAATRETRGNASSEARRPIKRESTISPSRSGTPPTRSMPALASSSTSARRTSGPGSWPTRSPRSSNSWSASTKEIRSERPPSPASPPCASGCAAPGSASSMRPPAPRSSSTARPGGSRRGPIQSRSAPGTFPAPDAVQSEMRQCKEPEPYNPGSCERWTLLDPSNVANQDCDDLNATVYPGAVNDEEGSEGYWDVPYCVNTGTQASGTWSSGWDCGPAAVSFDYDCSGGEDRSIASTKTNATCQKECQMCGFCDSSCQGGGGCTTCTQWGCSSSGWSGALPAC